MNEQWASFQVCFLTLLSVRFRKMNWMLWAVSFAISTGHFSAIFTTITHNGALVLAARTNRHQRETRMSDHRVVAVCETVSGSEKKSINKYKREIIFFWFHFAADHFHSQRGSKCLSLRSEVNYTVAALLAALSLAPGPRGQSFHFKTSIPTFSRLFRF